MITYIIILVLSIVITFGVNSIIAVNTNEFTVLYAFIASISNFTIIFALDAVIATILHALPRKLFDPFKKIYTVNDKEKNILIKIGIKKWKDKVPETGQFCNFKKDKLKGTEVDYLFTFLEETCYAEVIHIAMALIGFLDIIIWPIKYIWNFTLPLALVNFFINIPSILIQRYNRPRLMKTYIFKKREIEKNSDNI